MRAIFRTVFALALGLAIGAVASSIEQRGQGGGMPKYDKATEVTVKGTVQEVKLTESPMGWTGAHAILNTAEETLDVHLGPSGFLEERGFRLVEGDEVTVTGSKVKVDNQDSLLARELVKGDEKLALRDAQGFPRWSRRGRRNR